ncbi:MAG TPA: hypothetical protein VGW77_13435 [Candidatus Binatia bacterium]|jgi:hypothetical protein|nr:hypothetical protein [Candidatus Binatia bacterium]
MRCWQTLFLILLMLSGLASVHAQSPLGGLKTEITAVMIAGNRRPVVTFNARDVRGKPMDLDDRAATRESRPKRTWQRRSPP